MIIEADQFLHSSGEKTYVLGEVDDALFGQWQAVRIAGLTLELEVLPRGGPDFAGPDWLTITFVDADWGDYRGTVVLNDHGVTAAVETLIRNFDPVALGVWRERRGAEAVEAAELGRQW